MNQSSLASFQIPGCLELTEGPEGLPAFHLKGEGGAATILLHGAHIVHFAPEGAASVLWMSQSSLFADGKPVRGGIPVCWPWFGPHASRPELPAHGIARLRAWDVLESAVLHDGRVRLRLGFTPQDKECATIPAGLRVELALTVGRAMEVELLTINSGTGPATFEDALHTYFAVGNLAEARVTGLQGCVYADKVAGFRTSVQDGDIAFTAETDRVYRDTGPFTELLDGPRRVRIEKSGSTSTVVWNPWVAKSRAMPDFGDEEWREMCCVETANAMQDRVILLPGTQHSTRLRVSLV